MQGTGQGQPISRWRGQASGAASSCIQGWRGSEEWGSCGAALGCRGAGCDPACLPHYAPPMHLAHPHSCAHGLCVAAGSLTLRTSAWRAPLMTSSSRSPTLWTASRWVVLAVLPRHVLAWALCCATCMGGCAARRQWHVSACTHTQQRGCRATQQARACSAAGDQQQLRGPVAASCRSLAATA